jgi:hypothetical protein
MSHDERDEAQLMLNLTAEQIIESGRSTYRTIPADDIRSQETVFRVVGRALDLEGEDYEDLVRHLVTADVIDEEAWRWVTSGSRATAHSTVPEGSQGGGWNVSTTSGWSGRQV